MAELRKQNTRNEAVLKSIGDSPWVKKQSGIKCPKYTRDISISNCYGVLQSRRVLWDHKKTTGTKFLKGFVSVKGFPAQQTIQLRFKKNPKVKYFKEFPFLLNYINGYDMFKCLSKNLYLA